MNTKISFLSACTLLLLAGSTLAQRASFDATVIRKADVIVTEMARRPNIKAVNRSGMNASGTRMNLSASTAAISFENIFFKLDSTALRDQASAWQVREIAAAMKSARLKDDRFLIEGHTCDLGEPDYNLMLSSQRAEAIRTLLVKQGVRADRLAVLGFGERELVETVKAADSPWQAEAKRMKSRRVVLRRLLPPLAAKK